MKKTYMAQLYKYYVYVGPGVIEYFREEDYEKAYEYAKAHGAEVKEMDI